MIATKFILILCATFVAAQTDTNQTSTIDVTGTGTQTIPKSIVAIQLGVDNTASTAFQAQSMTSNAMNRVITTLQSLNVTDLQTDYLSIQPEYNYTQSSTKPIGFSATSTVSYKTDGETAGQTIDSAIRAGANRVNSVTSTADDATTADAMTRVLTDASNDALKKANEVATALNMCVGDPVTVQVMDENYPPSPTIMAYATMAAAESASAPTILPGKMDVSASVQVTFALTKC